MDGRSSLRPVGPDRPPAVRGVTWGRHQDGVDDVDGGVGGLHVAADHVRVVVTVNFAGSGDPDRRTCERVVVAGQLLRAGAP